MAFNRAVLHAPSSFQEPQGGTGASATASINGTTVAAGGSAMGFSTGPVSASGSASSYSGTAGTGATATSSVTQGGSTTTAMQSAGGPFAAPQLTVPAYASAFPTFGLGTGHDTSIAINSNFG